MQVDYWVQQENNSLVTNAVQTPCHKIIVRGYLSPFT